MKEALLSDAQRPAADSGILGRVDVPPLVGTKLVVGPFPAGKPLPELDVQITSGDHHDLVYMTERLTREDGLHIEFQFENFGDRTCRVIVRPPQQH